MDLKQRFAILNKYKKVVRELCDNELTIDSGIYMFYRTNENGERCFYVGQAKNLLQRTAEHLMGKKQHIDKSIYVHKLYSDDNPTGWKLRVLINCREEDLDHFEKFYIDFNKQQGFKCYNVSSGGQGSERTTDVGERLQTKLKSYKNGKGLGYEKAKNEAREFFNKYLDFSIKGKPNKVKERKLREFKEWLEVQNGEVKES